MRIGEEKTFVIQNGCCQNVTPLGHIFIFIRDAKPDCVLTRISELDVVGCRFTEKISEIDDQYVFDISCEAPVQSEKSKPQTPNMSW